MKATLSRSYTLKWQFKGAPHYCVSKCKKIINTRTNKAVKRCLNGGSIGYWIEGKWVSERKLKYLIETIQEGEVPF
jgi:hypothetical protein